MHTGDRDLLIATIRAAGHMALQLLAQGVSQWQKPDGSMVTDGDLVIDEFLKRELMGARPGYGWLSEESPDNPERLSATRVWIVDPIDGTRSFARKGSSWCIGIGLVERGRPILSCLYHPQLERLYVAEKGNGTVINNASARIQDTASGLKNLRVMGQKKVIEPLLHGGAQFAAANDTPLLARFAMIVSGEIDAAVSAGPKQEWDIAAGELLVTEAGGIVTDLGGHTLIYNQPSRQQPGIVAAAATRHKAIIETLEQS